MKTIENIKAIIHLREDRDNPVVGRFRGLTGKEIAECGDEAAVASAVGSLKSRGIGSKEVVILKKFMGRMFQKCPGSPGMICCNYRLMNTGFNCLYDCTYCFLNSYLNSFGIIQFINTETMFREIEESMLADRETICRIGTGEFTDSLMFDEVTGIAASLIRKASRYGNLFLELKTKSNNIRHLLDIREKGNAVLAWTLNTRRNIELYEAGTAPLEERIEAAAAACRAGFLTAFHFDPIILSNGWTGDYLDIVDRLFSRVDPGRVAWISMGCFRYRRGFKEIIRTAFPGQKITTAEMFPGPDAKYRYLKKMRADAYRSILGRIRSYTDRPFVYLCMETAEMWRSVFSREYRESSDLERDFNRHIKNYS
ncbi:MAG: hypothetical protein A2176_10655 [Spirochaetes bacterium RBG_13_51_14]|nr:MAG: hypothetical protein A2176_10655 [Spirochaetes bacterium RBG_13_51_14]